MRVPIIAVDFDGTIVTHCYPDIGKPVPHAISWLKTWSDAGARIILYTMRSGVELDQAVEYLAHRDVPLYGVNHNPDQVQWTLSCKIYAHTYVDDAAFGCPLKKAADGSRPHVDWSVVGPAVLKQIETAFLEAL